MVIASLRDDGLQLDDNVRTRFGQGIVDRGFRSAAMDNVVTIELAEDPESFLAWVREEISLRAGTVIGDVNFGNFSFGVPLGMLRGEYRVNERQLTIRVTDKPLFI